MRQALILFLVIGLVLLIGGCTYVDVQVRDMTLQCKQTGSITYRTS